jgi:hypothetical protein
LRQRLLFSSKVGFTPDLHAVAAAEGIRLVRAEEMVYQGPPYKPAT